MTLEAIGEKILVKQISAERVTKGGIVIPDSEANKYENRGVKGTIESIGGTAFREEHYVQHDLNIPQKIPRIGDTVIIGRYSGTLLKKGEEKYRLINDKDVLAIVKEDSDDEWQVA